MGAARLYAWRAIPPRHLRTDRGRNPRRAAPPELTCKYRGAANANIQTILDILAHAEIVIVDEIPAVSRDPKDDKFLATAALAGAEFLVSEDQDLLVLREYEGVRIVDAATFLDLLDA